MTGRIGGWLAVLAVLATGFPAIADEYPARPVKIIVPFAAGGQADLFTRAIAAELGARLGQPFLIDNRAGGGGIVGVDAAARAPADGYTLVAVTNTHTVVETLIPSRPYVLTRDFTGVAPICVADLVLAANPQSGVRSLADLLAVAKSGPATLSYASAGAGSVYHLAGEMLKSSAGLRIVHIPYKNASAARTDLMSGKIDLMFDSVSTMGEHVGARRVLALGTSGRQRTQVLPDIPTLAEAGVTGFESSIWVGLATRAGTPAAVVNRLNAAITAIVANPQLVAAWNRVGAAPMTMSAEEFDTFLRDDIIKWAPLVRQSKARPD